MAHPAHLGRLLLAWAVVGAASSNSEHRALGRRPDGLFDMVQESPASVCPLPSVSARNHIIDEVFVTRNSPKGHHPLSYVEVSPIRNLTVTALPKVMSTSVRGFMKHAANTHADPGAGPAFMIRRYNEVNPGHHFNFSAATRVLFLRWWRAWRSGVATFLVEATCF